MDATGQREGAARLAAAAGPLSGREVWERARGFGYSSNREKAMEDLQELHTMEKIKATGQGTHRKWSVS